MATILNDIMQFLDLNSLEQIIALGVVIVATVSLIFLFKKLV